MSSLSSIYTKDKRAGLNITEAVRSSVRKHTKVASLQTSVERSDAMRVIEDPPGTSYLSSPKLNTQESHNTLLEAQQTLG